jgi:hypothetical protein
LARVKLAYDVAERGAPHNLIYKCHLLENREVAVGLGKYRREVRFYQEAAGSVALRTPHCYYADIRDDEFYALLLEDMAPARAGLWTGDDLLARTTLAAREIAKFHATWWASPRLEGMPWLLGHNPNEVRRFYAFLATLVRQNWEAALQKVGSALSPTVLDIAARARDHMAWTCDQIFARPPRTLLHWDYSFDNILFASPQGGAPMAVLDWQDPVLGRGPYDVSVLLSSIPAGERRIAEAELLPEYHELPVANGVQGYSLEDCLYDYRIAMLEYLPRMIGGTFYSEGDRLLKYREIQLPRLQAAVLDNHVADLLPS